MVKNAYACTGCKKTFGRKYNAERHNIRIHNEMAVIYNKETGWVSNKRKTNENLQHDFSSSSPPPSSTSPPQSSSTLSTPFSSTTTATSSSDIDNKKTVSKPYQDFLKDFNFENHNSETNDIIDIEKIFKIFEKISPLIDDFDTQLTAYKIPEERIKILSESIIFALSSSNPVRSLKDIIKSHHSIKGIKKRLDL
jgi:hypothetical protein